MKKAISLLSMLFLAFAFASFVFIPYIEAAPAFEDFTTYTQVDPGTYINTTTTQVDHYIVDNTEAYCYKDYTAGYFTDFVIYIDALFDNASNGVNVWFAMFANNLDDRKGLIDGSKTYISLESFKTAAGDTLGRLEISESGSVSSDSTAANAIIEGTWYYWTFNKTGTALTAEIYNNTARTSAYLVDTLIKTLSSDYDFQYLYATNLRNRANPNNMDALIENLEITFPDTIAPTYFQMGINQTYAGNITYFYCEVNDTAPNRGIPGLSKSSLSHNSSGVWANRTWRSLGGGISVTANDTFAINNTVGVIIAFRFYVNDTSDNWLTTEIFTFPTDENASGGVPSVGGADVPFLTVFLINNTLAGNSTFILVTWEHSNVSKTLNYTIMETNNTGTPTNQTWKALSGTEDSANETLTLNGTVGTYVYLKWYCNDSVGGWAEETQVIVLTASGGADDGSGAFWFLTTILCGVGIILVIPLAKKLS